MGIPMDIVYVPDEYGNLIQTRVPTAIGFPFWFAGPEVPEGYLYCDGSEVNRNVYKELFAAIGTTWGAGDGTDTFNIPDLRGIFVRGDGGENNAALGVRQGDAIRNITGRATFRVQATDTNLGNIYNGAYGAFKQYEQDHDGTMDTLLSRSTLRGWQFFEFDASLIVPTAAENRPINLAMKPCIRYV